jgi:hypothetical protein
MRIYEIISENLIIIELKGLDYSFMKEYNDIVDIHVMFLHLKSAYRHRKFLGNIHSLKNKIQPFLDYDFDPDPDIDRLKNEARDILRKLDIIETEIP